MFATSYPGWFSDLVQLLMLLTTIGPLAIAVGVTGFGIKAIKNRRHPVIWMSGITFAWLIVILNQVFIVPSIPR